MTSPLTRDIADARAAWLAGDAEAWSRYVASLRILDARCADLNRPRSVRRTRRPLRTPRAEA